MNPWLPLSVAVLIVAAPFALADAAARSWEKSEFEALAESGFAQGRLPRSADLEQPWFCLSQVNGRFVLDNDGGLSKADGDDGGAFRVTNGGRVETRDDAVLASFAKPRDGAFFRAFRIVEWANGTQLVIENSSQSKASAGQKRALISGKALLNHTLCLQYRDVFGAGVKPSFDAYARESFENGRLPSTAEMKGDWNCLYVVDGKLKITQPPLAKLRENEMFLSHLLNQKDISMEIIDKAWVAPLRAPRKDNQKGERSDEPAVVRAAYRVQRAPEGLRLLQETTGVTPDGKTRQKPTKRSSGVFTSVCIKSDEFINKLRVTEPATNKTNLRPGTDRIR